MRSSLFGEAKESVKGLKYFAQRNEVRRKFHARLHLLQYISASSVR